MVLPGCLLLALTAGVAVLSAPSGYISIDCGGSTTYTDTFGVPWEGDANFIQTGQVGTVQNSADLYAPLSHLRYFPTRKKNCYTVPGIPLGTKTLVRASFYYGNYDGLSSPPSFDLQFDANPWKTVETLLYEPVVLEMVYVTRLESVSVCVARTNGSNTPFISSLELRSLLPTVYNGSDPDRPFFTLSRVAFGSPQPIIRYKDDQFDRYWYAAGGGAGTVNVTSACTSIDTSLNEQPPAAAMKHAITPSSPNETTLIIPLPVLSTDPQNYYYYFYFSEVVLNGKRSFNFKNDHGPVLVTPPYGYIQNVYCMGCSLSSSSSASKLIRSSYSLLPPIINAYELLLIGPTLVNGTNATDVGGLKSLQGHFVQLQSWSGDPCLPVGFSWEWLNCSAGDSPRVTNLHLSNFGLTGPLPDFSIMEALKTIDLSNNSLTGEIPNFLGKLPNLKELNLAFNCFTNDTLPPSLQEKSGIIILNVTGKNTCNTKPGIDVSRGGKKVAVIVGATVGSFVLLLLLISGSFLCRRSRKPPPSVSTNATNDPQRWAQQPVDCLIAENQFVFTYAEIVKMTNNLERFIGKGGTGRVYYGRLQNPDGIEVAVKLLQDSSCHGIKELVGEVRLLMKVHHKNLVSFVGFCEESNHMAVVYEYMHYGSLKNVLTGNSQINESLTWKRRLQIALDVATGLQYLHSGCHPAIIHRDVKSANILLNEQLEAKLADFGISKAATTCDETNPTVSGTPGYIDPESYQTFRVTDKSDVYSFGVVFLELISGLSAIFNMTDGQNVHIASWASSMITQGEMDGIIDPRIAGKLISMDSMCSAAHLAMACTKDKSANRPDMNEVVQQLRGAIELQTQYEGSTENTQTNQSSVLSKMSSIEITHPAAR